MYLETEWIKCVCVERRFETDFAESFRDFD